MLELVEIGKTFKTQGIKGELELELDEIFQEWIEKEKIIFIYINGTAVPFWITNIRNDSRMFFKLEEIDSPESAKKLSNKIIFADKSKFPKKLLKLFENQIQLTGLEGFQLHDLHSGIQATILSIQEYPSQTMAEVEYKENVIMIPLHEDFILKIDEKKKIIEVNLPEGIFNI